MIALDTNILLRRARTSDPLFAAAAAATKALHARGETLCIFPQQIYEFWATATRPITANGLGMTIAEAEARIAVQKRAFLLLPDSSDLLSEWESVVVIHSCHGRISYDARIVAAMNTHGIREILTFNAADFRRFPHITVIDPHSFAGS